MFRYYSVVGCFVVLMFGCLVNGWFFGWWFWLVVCCGVCVCFRVWVCGLFCLGLGGGFGLCVLVWVFIVLWYCDLFWVVGFEFEVGGWGGLWGGWVGCGLVMGLWVGLVGLVLVWMVLGVVVWVGFEFVVLV